MQLEKSSRLRKTDLGVSANSFMPTFIKKPSTAFIVNDRSKTPITDALRKDVMIFLETLSLTKHAAKIEIISSLRFS
jgi:hypothetical protein